MPYMSYFFMPLSNIYNDAHCMTELCWQGLHYHLGIIREVFMNTKRLHLVLSDRFIQTALETNVNVLGDTFNHVCKNMGVEPINNVDYQRAQAIYNATAMQATACTFDAPAYVYYWLREYSLGHNGQGECFEMLIETIINTNVSYLFLDAQYYFDINNVEVLFNQCLELFTPMAGVY